MASVAAKPPVVNWSKFHKILYTFVSSSLGRAILSVATGWRCSGPVTAVDAGVCLRREES